MKNIENRYIRRTTEKDQLINSIIEIEWNMFDKVNNIGGRASCQDDLDTFYIMRYSQFNALSAETLNVYLDDLKEAEASGRNVVEEKYAYMMEETDRKYFTQVLKNRFPELSWEKEKAVEQLAGRIFNQEKDFAVKYPEFSKTGRPLVDDHSGWASFYNYVRSEMKTYSERMLELYFSDAEDTALVDRIYETMVGFYGYENVEMLEEHLRKEKER